MILRLVFFRFFEKIKLIGINIPKHMTSEVGTIMITTEIILTRH